MGNLQLIGNEIKYTAFDRDNDFRSNAGGHGCYHTNDGYAMGLNQPFADLVVLESYGYDDSGIYRATTSHHIWIGDNEIGAEVIQNYINGRRKMDKRAGHKTPVEYRFVGGLENYYDPDTGKPLEFE